MNDFVGIDVSKSTLDIHCLKANASWQERNDQDGHEALALRLAGAELVVLESSGSYHFVLVQSLQDAGIPVFVANPRWIKQFRASMGKLAKTDTLDAKLLAQFGERMCPEPTASSSAELQRLKALNAHRQDLTVQMSATKNRLKQAREALVKEHLTQLLETLKHLQKQVDQAIAFTLKHTVEFADKAAFMLGVKGVGPVLTATLLSELPELGQVNSKQIAALVGVAPFDCTSGVFTGKKRIWGGRKGVRNILYMAANVARRYVPEMKAYYEHLRQKGKEFKVALVACMRKLLVQLNAKVRDAFYPTRCLATS